MFDYSTSLPLPKPPPCKPPLRYVSVAQRSFNIDQQLVFAEPAIEATYDAIHSRSLFAVADSSHLAS